MKNTSEFLGSPAAGNGLYEASMTRLSALYVGVKLSGYCGQVAADCSTSAMLLSLLNTNINQSIKDGLSNMQLPQGPHRKKKS